MKDYCKKVLTEEGNSRNSRKMFFLWLTYIYIYLSVYIYIYIYIYNIHIHIHTIHTYTYIYLYIHTWLPSRWVYNTSLTITIKKIKAKLIKHVNDKLLPLGQFGKKNYTKVNLTILFLQTTGWQKISHFSRLTQLSVFVIMFY